LKTKKAVSEEKEQLAHTVVKVKSDIDAMKAKYQETVSNIHALIADPTLATVVKDGAVSEATQNSETISDLDSSQLLSQASVARLKKMNHLVSTQVEKTESKLRTRLADLGNTMQELQQRIR